MADAYKKMYDAVGTATARKFEQDSEKALLASFSADWKKKYLGLAHHGTDNALNVRDAMGDGDQTLLRYPMSQYHRDIFSVGGDVHAFAQSPTCPSFIKSVLIGNAKSVRETLELCSTVEEKTALTETRYSILRFSALFFAIVGMAQIVSQRGCDHLGVLKALIEHGARVDAKDLCGKTVSDTFMQLLFNATLS
jgi:hypothetical protein